MWQWSGTNVRFSVLLFVLVGCAAPAAPGGAVPRDAPPAPAQVGIPKRIVVSVTTELPSLRAQTNRAAGGILAGAPELEQLTNAGLAIADDRSQLRPQLAEAVPSVENGLWRVFPDGRMETTWKLREGIVWHDGGPYTAEDLVFTAMVIMDPELPVFRKVAFDSIESTQALDSRTFVIRWQRPFIEADQTFSAAGALPALPMPRHLLEPGYRENKASFGDSVYFGEEFVGAGPYKLREWQRGSHVVLDANDRYVFGRPKIDVVEVRFIPDPTTMVANLLAGAVDQPIGRGVGFEQGLLLRDQWRDGRVEFAPGSGIKIWPQLLYPNPQIIGDVRFRRAAYHAIDRQQLADTLVAGQADVAHTIVTPGDAEYPEIVGRVVKYEYDPRRTAQLLEELGYTRGADGRYRDAAGQPLVIEFRSSPMDILRKTKLAVADNWQSAGIGVTVLEDSPQQRGDNQYRATFPGFDISRATSGAESFQTFRSSEARTVQTRYFGENSSNYMNPEFDALVDRYLTTIPWADRMRVAGDIVHHMTDQVLVMDQFYDATPTAVAKRIANVSTRAARRGTTTWNAHEWDIQ